MKLYFILAFILLSCFQCKQHSTHLKKASSQSVKPFFDFDNVMYFKTTISEKDFDSLIINGPKNKNQGDFLDLLANYSPKKIVDIDTNKFTAIGYTKVHIDSSSIQKIRVIFSEKDSTDIYTTACVPIFRDILVFIKKQKITGIAKICFGCRQYYFLGTTGNIDYFGSDQDYKNLSSVLH